MSPGASDGGAGGRDGPVPGADDLPDPMRFPMAFPVKIMGPNTEGFVQAVADIVRAHAPGFDPATIESNVSRQGNYVSLTATIEAQSRAQLDALYRELTAHPMVKVVL